MGEIKKKSVSGKKKGETADVSSRKRKRFASSPPAAALGVFLKDSDTIFRQLLDSAPDPIVAIDKEGLIAVVNQQTEKIFGYTWDELLGQPVEMLIPERFRNNHPSQRDSYFASPVTGNRLKSCSKTARLKANCTGFEKRDQRNMYGSKTGLFHRQIPGEILWEYSALLAM